MVNDQMIEIKDLSASRGWGKSKETAKATGSGPPRTEPDAMDWEPSTAVGTVRTMVREPRWASPEEIERRRQDGLCLRCGKKGHMVRTYNAKLKKREIAVAAVKVKTDKPPSYDLCESNKSEKE
jgi:hypothetical protein